MRLFASAISRESTTHKHERWGGNEEWLQINLNLWLVFDRVRVSKRTRAPINACSQHSNLWLLAAIAFFHFCVAINCSGWRWHSSIQTHAHNIIRWDWESSVSRTNTSAVANAASSFTAVNYQWQQNTFFFLLHFILIIINTRRPYNVTLPILAAGVRCMQAHDGHHGHGGMRWILCNVHKHKQTII